MKKMINFFTGSWLQRVQQLCKLWQAALLLSLLGFGLPSFAQSNLLINGNFSSLPTLQGADQIVEGNNIFTYAYALPGWTFTVGEAPNLVKVLGSVAAYPYYPSGPNSDVTTPGGVGYYLDIAGGANEAYQTFKVPSCGQAGTATYKFSGYFSGRDGQTGNGSIKIVQGAGISGTQLAVINVVAASNAGGLTTGGWISASSTVSLTAGQTYSYVIKMDNPVNFDQAELVPLTVLGCADMSVVVDIPQATATLGSLVNGTVSFANISNNPAVSPTFTLQMTPGLAGVSVTSLVLGAGSYNPTSGIVTFPAASVPASVTPNTVITAAIKFTQPNNTVNVTATTGAVNDTIATNNTGADSVAFAPNIVPTTEQGTAPAGVTTTAIANVASNDNVNGVPATLGTTGNATIDPGVLPTGVTLNTTTGAVTVAPSVAPGTYTFTYILCDKNTPKNCAPMTDTVVVTPTKGSISGIAWIDSNGNGVLDGNEPRVPDLRVGVFTTNAAGVRTEVTNPAARPITNATGQYRLADLPSSDFGGPTYEIVFFNEAGQAVLGTPKSMSGTTNDGTVPNTLDRIVGVKVPGGGETTLQNLPLDPSGVVYDSASRTPVPGAVVTFTGPSTFNPAIHLVGGAANVSQTTGASGVYKFQLLPGAPAGIYGLAITPPATYTLSTSIPAQVGALPSVGPAGGINAVVPNALAPQVAPNDPTRYFLSFQLIPGTSADVVHNHIPLDSGVPYKLGMSKVANRATGELGDTVLYTVKLRNTGAAVVPSGTVITDRLPAGFKYIPGTSQGMAPGVTAATAIPDPAGGLGPVLEYTIVAPLPAGAEYSLQYRVRIGVGALQGDGINRVQARIGKSVSNTAEAKVVPQGGVFTNDACLAGKIFVDCNNNHIQDAEEVGVPGVRLYLSDGTNFVTDSEGKYSYCGLQPNSHVIAVDMLTMPRGSRMTTTSNRNLGDANSLFLDVKNGQLIRADFAEGSCSNTVMEQVNARRAKGEIRAPGTEKKGQPALKWEGKSSRYPQQGTNSADQILVAPRPINGGAASVPEQDTPVPQIPAASSNTRGSNVRETK